MSKILTDSEIQSLIREMDQMSKIDSRDKILRLDKLNNILSILNNNPEELKRFIFNKKLELEEQILKEI